ncbi:hypothetical protein AK812_SmicGene29210 [Symbiodinium microadriaticum]|uniref:Uncharacterized protein n=1 Tax=Symbiodinium microadriaticum TaxID=2951 RepID=A0A1Q9D2C8_SYMMI|nr:hypothetical protein AK812_SmicGene29210 [Symbiodinium microadriaticum]
MVTAPPVPHYPQFLTMGMSPKTRRELLAMLESGRSRSILVGTRFRQRPRLGPPREPVYHFILTDHFIPHPRCWQVGPLSSVDRIAVVTNGRDEEGSAKNWWCTDDAKVCQQAFQKTINENCNILCFQAVPETAEESRDV